MLGGSALSDYGGYCLFYSTKKKRGWTVCSKKGKGDLEHRKETRAFWETKKEPGGVRTEGKGVRGSVARLG